MDKVNASLHFVPNDTPTVELNCRAAFEDLSPTERLYAHHIARASFEGSLIVFLQVSPESAGIFVLIHRIFSSESVDELKTKALAAGFADDGWLNFLVWSATICTNCGNYKQFGSTKFIPNISAEKLKKLVLSSKAASIFPDLLSIYETVEKGIFYLDKNTAELGFNDTGVTTYHSDTVRKEDSDLINRYMMEKNLEGWNTRLFKEEIDGKIILTIKTASIKSGSTEDEFEGVRVKQEKGDYAEILARVCPHLNEAIEYAANAKQKGMLVKYVDHFTTGELNDHKDASRLWIKDVNPIVESYIGFIENYKDPAGVRSEFEGFVAVVNKETSKKYTCLVENAEMILERLPWGKAYEKDKFLKPDFTALDVIAFGASGVYLGINIPNYDEIRQNEGFKNVTLANSITARMRQSKKDFVSTEDEILLNKYNEMAFEVQVGLHELLGHGSGKLFQMNADGSFNFDKENTVDILTGGKITSWYKPGETWGGVFGHLSNPYEECRAEAVGYVMCGDEDVLKIFGFDGEIGRTIKYVNWLSSIHKGLIVLEFYNAEKDKWGQAHSWGRFMLLKVVLEAGEGFVTIEETKDSEGRDDLSFKMDKTKIDSVGKPAVMEFLKKLQAYKSTADVKGATALFNKYAVGPAELKWREIVISKRKPRQLLVQSNTKVTDDGKSVELVNYPETPEGVIQSIVERYSPESIATLENLWKAHQKYFPRAYGKN